MKTTINGKEIKLYDDNDINAIYTDLVSEYISKGFVINFRTVRGSQGEESKIDLTNDDGKTIYRIWILIEYVDGINNKKLVIVIEKFLNFEARDILLFGRGEKILEKDFYFINKRSRNIYVESKDDFEIIVEIQKSRTYLKYKEFYGLIELSDSCKKIALKIIRKKKGYKTVKIDDLNSVSRRYDVNGYYFDFKKKENFAVRIKKV